MPIIIQPEVPAVPEDCLCGVQPMGVFVSSFLVAAFAGLASLLRTGAKLTTVSVISAILNSGLVGLGISLLWYTKFQDNVYFLIGICVLAGLGGATTVDMILNSIKAGGFSLKIGPNGGGAQLGNEEKK